MVEQIVHEGAEEVWPAAEGDRADEIEGFAEGGSASAGGLAPDWMPGPAQVGACVRGPEGEWGIDVWMDGVAGMDLYDDRDSRWMRSLQKRMPETIGSQGPGGSRNESWAGKKWPESRKTQPFAP